MNLSYRLFFKFMIINVNFGGELLLRCILIYSSEGNYCFPEFHTSIKSAFNGNINDDVFTGTVSASTSLSTKII